MPKYITRWCPSSWTLSWFISPISLWLIYINNRWYIELVHGIIMFISPISPWFVVVIYRTSSWDYNIHLDLGGGAPPCRWWFQIDWYQKGWPEDLSNTFATPGAHCWAHASFFFERRTIKIFYTGWWFGCHQFYFPRNIGLLIILIDELIFFRGVAQPPTRYCIVILDETQILKTYSQSSHWISFVSDGKHDWGILMVNVSICGIHTDPMAMYMSSRNSPSNKAVWNGVPDDTTPQPPKRFIDTKNIQL